MRRAGLVGVTLAVLAAGGCAGGESPSATPGPTVTQTTTGGTLDPPLTVRVEKPAPTVERSLELPIPDPTAIRPVVAGPLPLVYLLESGSVVTVVEAQSRATLVSLPLDAPTIVRVDARRGVVAGRTVVRPGPLDESRQYEIYVGDESADVFRTRAVTRPGEN
jgi:hypothetical protein